MGTNWKLIGRMLRLVIVVGLAFFLTIIPSSNAGHLATSPATFLITANPSVVDGVAIRGETSRSSTGSADFVVGVVGSTTGNATGQDGAVVAVRGVATGNATGQAAGTAGLQGRAFGNAVGTDSALFGAQGRVNGNATGLNSALVGVQGRVTATDPAGFTGQNAFAVGILARVEGNPTGPGAGVYGVFARVLATSGTSFGVSGVSESTSGIGVNGFAAAPSGNTVGVRGSALSPSGVGVSGSAGAIGVQGSVASTTGFGVQGINLAAAGRTVGVSGIANAGDDSIGVEGRSQGRVGIGVAGFGVSQGVGGYTASPMDGAAGVYGINYANSGNTRGVWGLTASPGGYGVIGEQLADAGYGVRGLARGANGIAVVGDVTGAATRAGLFNGRVDITCGSPATGCLFVDSHRVGDLAEDLPSLGKVAPGDAVVLATTAKEEYGVMPARRAYDTRVAGVVSDEPRIHFRVRQEKPMAAIAMVGVVRAKATTVNGPIQFGDLLTTSSVPGHLMRCPAAARCVGAIVGKALQPLPKGKTQILVLLWRQ